MVKAARCRHRRLERFLAGVTEGRMADVMRQRQRFGEVLIKPKRPRDRARDLRNFEAVGQPDTEVIAIRRDEHLGLVTQATKGDRMEDRKSTRLKSSH